VNKKKQKNFINLGPGLVADNGHGPAWQKVFAPLLIERVALSFSPPAVKSAPLLHGKRWI
jgi:hypothetical protein